MRLIATFSVFAIVQYSSVAWADVAQGLAPHRAVYDIELADASERSRIESMFGRMVYEFSGSPCAGYKVDFRFVSQLDTGASVRVTDQQTQTHEDIEKKTFSFKTQTYVNDKLDKEVSGNAALEGDVTSIRLKLPEADNLTLAASEFPTAQMITLIEKARAGESFFQSRLYDGTEEGREIMLTSNIVGSSRIIENDGEADALGLLKDEPVWPVTVAYFDEAEQGDGVPIYRISFKLHENGVTRDLVMDYGEFTLNGKLTSLEVFDSENCE